MNSRAIWEDRCLSVLRIVFGFLLLQHGTQKLLGMPPQEHPMALAVGSQMWIGAVIELVGGAMITLGLLTRFAAFVCSGQMAVAYFQFHAPGGFWPVVNHGEPAVAYCFVFLFLVFAGGGAWSLDRLVFKHRPSMA